MAQSVKSSEALVRRLESARTAIECEDFPTRAPESFIQRIQADDPTDPLLLQILPREEEFDCHDAYQTDPLEEQKQSSLPGLIEKYQGRVLITLTGACAIHCRYCFRRHFPYADNIMKASRWQTILEYLQQHSSISEVIFSGGDPLSLSDDQLSAYVEDLQDIPSLRRLRIHSRLPLVIPNRVNEDLLAWIKKSTLQVIMVLHINHSQEMDQAFFQAVQQLKSAGVALFNQTVLLRDINDDAETLISLSENLFAHGIQPYYIHLLDKVQGAAHFDVPLEKARELYQELKRRLPGYLLPRMVREQAGVPFKQDLLEL